MCAHKGTARMSITDRHIAIEDAARKMLSLWKSKCRPGEYHRWIVEMDAAECELVAALEGNKVDR